MSDEVQRRMFHTQEFRRTGAVLTAPMKCIRADAWLGSGYYFWYDEDDAHDWGRNSKQRTGEYQIYLAEIDCDQVLDAVFNEKHYLFWVRQIEKISTRFVKDHGVKPTLKELNTYFREKGTWDDVAGIMFDDKPINPRNMVKMGSKSGNTKFVYKKRIQLVAFNLEIVSNFTSFCIEKCD